MLQEIAQKVGFIKGQLVLPTKQTNHLDKFTECLAREWETDLETPHTLIMEFQKYRRPVALAHQ